MSEPIRILQVFAQMNRGGAETMIMNLYRHIDRSKIQFDFIVHTKEKCAFDDEITQLGGRIFRVPKYNGLNHFAYKRAWKKILVCNPNYKIIHGHVRSTAAIYLNLAKKTKAITICHSHATSSRGKIVERLVKKLMQFPLRFISDYFFACSNEAAIWLFGKNILNNNNYYLFKNAINLDLFNYNDKARKATRERLGLNEELLIGHVGSFTKEKNHEFLIDVYFEISKRLSSARLLLIGDGTLIDTIKTKINELKINDKVKIIQNCDRVYDYYMAMDLFVFPSLHEGLGIALIEAQAAGLQCYASQNRVPIEAKVTENVEFLPIELTAEKWADYIITNLNREITRKSSLLEFKDKGYDIKDTSNWLEKFYLGFN